MGRLIGTTTQYSFLPGVTYSNAYGYDAASNRTSFTAPDGSTVNYAYDTLNRLSSLTDSATGQFTFGYDALSRRTSLTRPNGVNVSYSYDNDSRVTGITYNFGATLLGNLGYSYDSLGRRTQVSGSLARTGFPGAVASATYDAANELTNWNGTLISYDLNGNMLSDGTNAFTWNARNQVASLNGRNLQYDAYGRRIQNSLGTAFLYDGSNAAQELSGTTPTANLLSGGIDESFSRADSSGSFTPLADALGSTIALVDASGNLSTQYTYDPFGNTTSSGLISSNPSQYTGRENEANGLYFYRARYYSPLLGRFAGEDPLGFIGSGSNVYAYVGDDPIDFSDAFGLARGDWWDARSYYTDGWTTLRDAGTAAEAFTDALTFGSASRLNDALGAGGMVDRCGIGHKLASAAGIVAGIALGGAKGLEEGLDRQAGEEWSHWIPDRAKISRGGKIPDFVVDSDLNGQYMSPLRHALNDKWRNLAGMTSADKNPFLLQQLMRIPPWVTGAVVGGAFTGTSAALAGRNCGCK